MTRLYLVRHGETSGNANETFRGILNLALTEKGKEQAGYLAVAFSKKNPDAVYSSPLKRALDTADPVSEPHILPVSIESRFTDMDFGEWQGKGVSEVKALYPEIYNEWIENPYRVKIPGAGNLAVHAKEAFSALNEIARIHENGEIIIISHRLTLKTLISSALGTGEYGFWKIRIDCASISLLEFDGKHFILSLLNEKCHLRSSSSVQLDF